MLMAMLQDSCLTFTFQEWERKKCKGTLNRKNIRKTRLPRSPQQIPLTSGWEMSIFQMTVIPEKYSVALKLVHLRREARVEI